MWLIKTKVRAVLDHSHKSSVPIRGWQLNPVLVGSHWSSICTFRHPFHPWNMAPLTRFCEDMFSYTLSPKAVCWHGTNELTLLMQSRNVTWTRFLAQISVLPALCGLSLLLWFPLARDSSLSWGWWNDQKSDWQPLHGLQMTPLSSHSHNTTLCPWTRLCCLDSYSSCKGSKRPALTPSCRSLKPPSMLKLRPLLLLNANKSSEVDGSSYFPFQKILPSLTRGPSQLWLPLLPRPGENWGVKHVRKRGG